MYLVKPRQALSFVSTTIIPPKLAQFLLNILSNLTKAMLVFLETMLEMNFRLSGMIPRIALLDDEKTVMNFWIPKNRRPNTPNLVLIHGYGGNSRWQFAGQIWRLSRAFNLYVPDLLFFGESYTNRTDRSDAYQAKCVREALKTWQVNKFSVVGVSYGGFVAYKMAEMNSMDVEKVVIVSSGICYTDDQKYKHLEEIGEDPLKLLLPEKPEDLRLFIRQCLHKRDPTKWVPDFFLQETIKVMYKDYKKERSELANHLLLKNADPNLPVITQETLIIWGDKDNIFPLYMAYQLKRHLGLRAKVAVVQGSGHGVNIESPNAMNELILSFVAGCRNYN